MQIGRDRRQRRQDTCRSRTGRLRTKSEHDGVTVNEEVMILLFCLMRAGVGLDHRFHVMISNRKRHLECDRPTRACLSPHVADL